MGVSHETPHHTRFPYARIVWVFIVEKGLTDRVEIVTTTIRDPNKPYHGINSSGRVRYLIRDGGVGMEESAIICVQLDHLDGKPAFDRPTGE